MIYSPKNTLLIDRMLFQLIVVRIQYFLIDANCALLIAVFNLKTGSFYIAYWYLKHILFVSNKSFIEYKKKRCIIKINAY